MSSARDTSPSLDSPQTHSESEQSDSEQQKVLPTPPERRLQPWKQMVAEIKQKEEATGNTSNDGKCEWFTSKEGYYYNHTT
jgi:hypothetical protein